MVGVLCARRVIFPGRRQPSIVTVNELNYCVRNGNRCTLVTIDTHLLLYEKCFRICSLCFIPLPPAANLFLFVGDPWGNRTPVCGVRGRRLNRLTNGPFLPALTSPVSLSRHLLWTSACRYPQATASGTPSRARTVDPLIKSQLLYQLS